MAKLTVNEAALQGFTDVVSFQFGEDFKLDTTSDAGVVKTYAVPEGTLITNASVHVVEAFAGGSISDCRLDIGFGGDGSGTIDDFIDDLIIFTGADEFTKNTGAKLIGGSGARGHQFDAADTIDIEFTPVGDSMANATSGKVVIKFTLLDMRDPAEIS